MFFFILSQFKGSGKAVRFILQKKSEIRGNFLGLKMEYLNKKIDLKSIRKRDRIPVYE